MRKRQQNRKREVREQLVDDLEVHATPDLATSASSLTSSNVKAKFANLVCSDSRYESLEGATETEGGAPIYDQQRRSELLTEYYESQVNKSPNRHAALDIFLMLDQENDQYLKLEEIEPMWPFIARLGAKHQGKLQSKEDLTEHFNKQKQFQINQRTFNEFLDETEINVPLVRQMLYNSQYRGCCRRCFCACCKPCNRKVRSAMVMQMMRKEDQALKDFIFGFPSKNQLKEDMIALVIAILGAYTEISHHVTDIVLLNTVYWTGMRHPGNHSYKFATVFIFMSVSSVYLIAYSSMINMLLFKGVYEPAQVRRNSCCQVFLKLIFLTFIGPFYFIFIELASKLMAVCTSLAMILAGKRGYLVIRMKFLGFIESMFALTEEQIDGLNKQRGVIQLLFESLPMAILQLLIRYEFLQCQELAHESAQILLIALILTLFNAFVTLFMISVESKALQEPKLEFNLNSFKARQGWIPFMHQIEQKELKQAVEYGQVRCSYPVITDLTGLYKTFRFQFSDTSLQVLTSELVKWGSTTTEEPGLDSDEEEDAMEKNVKEGEEVELIHNKYIIDLTNSVNLCSINSVLHLYNLTPRNRITLKFREMDWDLLMRNAKKSHLIYSVPLEDKKQARTPSGVHLLQICVEDEKIDNPSSKELHQMSYNLNRKMELARTACRYLSEKMQVPEFVTYEAMIDNFDPAEGKDAIMKLQQQVDDLMITQNPLVMRQLHKKLKRAMQVYDDISKRVAEYESELEESVYNRIGTLVSRATSSRLDKRIESDLKIADEKLAETELKTEIKEEIERYKTVLTDEAKKQEDFTKEFSEFNDEVHEKLKSCKNFYDLGEIAEKYYNNQTTLIQKNGDSDYRIKQAKKTVDRIVKELWELPEASGELLTYEPFKDDERDVKFAEVYNSNDQIRKYPCRQVTLIEEGNGLKHNEGEHESEMMDVPKSYIPKGEYRHYCIGGVRMIWEHYSGDSNYMIFPPGGLDTTSSGSFFESLIKFIKPSRFWQPKENPFARSATQQIKAKMEAKKNKDQNTDTMDMEATFNNIKDKELHKIRLQTLLEPQGMKNFDVLYPQFASILPPIEKFELSSMTDVPYFTNPNQWILMDCMQNLLEKQQCNPNVLDNYGETLLNFAIKSNKMKSFDLLLQNKVNVNITNQHQMSPLGQAFVSRNPDAVEKLLKHGANIETALVMDQDVSNKPISPLCYFIKRMRLGNFNWKADKKILDVLIDNEVKVTSESDKLGFHKQLARMFATDMVQKTKNHNQIIDEFILPLYNDFDLLSFRDNKDNTLIHCHLKTYQVKMTSDFYSDSYFYKFIPQDLSREEVKLKLTKLIDVPNRLGQNPFEIAIGSQEPDLVNFICDNFIDIFNFNQELMVLDFIFEQTFKNFRADFYKGPRLDAITRGLLKKCADSNKLKGMLFDKVQNEPAGDGKKNALYNLNQYLGMGEPVQMSKGSQDADRSYKRDMDQALQDVKIIRPEGPKGEFMRYIDEEEAKKKEAEFHGKSMNQSISKEHFSMMPSMFVRKHEQPANPYFELGFTLLLEAIALFDMIGDIYLMIQMYVHGHTAWFTISIFTTLSPFYVCYVPLLTFQKTRSKLQEETKFLKFLNIASLTPFIVAYLLLMDIIYIVVSVIITPTAMIIKLLTCGLIDMTNIEEKLDVLYEILFGMTDMDIKGFRRLRTISQLSFESLPQIVLQVRILIYALNGDDKLGVGLAAINASLGCALVHAFFEMIFVYLEAVSCKTTVIHYMIVCFNARFGWIPFVNFFSSLAGFDENSSANPENLNYEAMKSGICGVKFQMKFKFSNSSAAVLINSLSNLRNEKDPKKRMNLSIGESINEVDFPIIMDLMRISHNRINLDLSEVDIKVMVNRSKVTLDEIKSPQKVLKNARGQEYYSLENQTLIQEIARLGQSSVVGEILEIEGVNQDFKPTLFEIAKEVNNYEIVKMIMNKPGFKESLGKITDSQCYLHELLTNKHEPIVTKGLFSNPDVIICEQYKMIIFNDIVHMIMDKKYTEAFSMHQAIFGSICPNNLMRGAGDSTAARSAEQAKMDAQYKQIKDELDEFLERFPTKFYVYSCNPEEEKKHPNKDKESHYISTDIASCFSVLREQAIRLWDLSANESDYLGSEENPLNLWKYKISETAFLTVCKLLSPQHFKITKLDRQQIKACDKVVAALALDQNRPCYFYRSREGDQTHSTYKLNVQQETKISLDEETVTKDPDWKSKVVIVKERFIGKTSKGFEFTLPEDVIAVKRFRIQYDYLGGSIQLNHISDIHQSSIEISNEHTNSWFTDIQVEEFNEDPTKMQGYMDILANAQAGHTIQLWLQTNGYAFSKNIDCELEVFTKIPDDEK